MPSDKDINKENVEKLKQEYANVVNDLKFAKLAKASIWNVLDQSTKPNPTYTRYTKEQILKYMQAPSANEKNIRKASVYMYDASSQYRRLITYYANILTWAYILAPINYSSDKANKDAFKKQYLKVTNYLNVLSLKHELEKAMKVLLREGVFYGASYSTSDSFFIQPIPAEYCSVNGAINGCFTYVVDMSQIRENKLMLYPPEFITMYNTYQKTGEKYQEVPDSISFCLKADDTTTGYSIPPFAATLPMLYDIETYKSLQVTASAIANYKMITMKVPLDSKSNLPVMSFEEVQKYYNQVGANLPEYVGLASTPFEVDSVDFEKSGGVDSVDIVSRAEEQFWQEGGTSSLLFGSPDGKTAGALELSIKTDEETMFAIQVQVERLINKMLLSMSGTQKFKITFLGSTIFNQKDMITLYKEAATLGIPGSKSAYASLLGIVPGDIQAMNMMEMDMLGMGELTPLQTSYTTAGEAGRPEKDATDLTDSGDATRESGANENK
ncbi:MAG: hypothetical protein WCR36_11605 [Bacteroidaceae bacterium]